MLRARFVVRPKERQSLGLLPRQRKRSSSSASGPRNFGECSFARGCRAARIAGSTMHGVPKRRFRRDAVGNFWSDDLSSYAQLPHLESSSPRRKSTFLVLQWKDGSNLYAYASLVAVLLLGLAGLTGAAANCPPCPLCSGQAAACCAPG